tara:strand:+ start:187 stop:1365 length:1179 start_codon:yes stop_codon:yes gene_type:complete
MTVFMRLKIKYSAHVKKLFMLCCVLIALPGCSWLFGDEGLYPSRTYDYLTVEEKSDLILPEGIKVSAINDQYPIPDISTSQLPSDKYEVPRVQSLESAEQKGSVKVQRFDQRQWILVNASSGQVWPLVANFLSSNQIPIASSNGNGGVIETDWLSDNISDEVEPGLSMLDGLQAHRTTRAGGYRSEAERLQERYRFILKPGVQKSTTEIEITQQTATNDTRRADSIYWGDTSTNEKREDNMVNLLAEHLANSPNQASYSLLAQGIGSASKVKLRYDNSNQPYLSLVLSFDRAWASLGLALKKAAFEISDLDRSKGYYLTSSTGNVEEKNKRGLLSRLFSRSKEATTTTPGVLEFSARYNGSSLIIQVQSQTGTLLSAKEQTLILRRVQKKLS